METGTLAAVIGAAVPGVLALVLGGVLWMRVRRARLAQRILLGDGDPVNLVDGQAHLAAETASLRAGLADLQALVDAQAQGVAREFATVIRFQGLVRYDAYRDMGGGQSWSMALLDEHSCGTVMTCLHARDHARVYVKDVVEGVSSQRLSPEEIHAIELAMGSHRGPHPGHAVDAG